MEPNKPKMNVDRLISIGALILAVGSAAFSSMRNTNSLEFMTKTDFNTFQIENVKKMTALEGTVQNGFLGVSQQLAGLQFVGTKDFQDFKDKSTKDSFELQKSIDFLKKDLEQLQKSTESTRTQIEAIRSRIAFLEAMKTGQLSPDAK